MKKYSVRISFPELVKMRGPNGASAQIPLGQVPVVEFPDGTSVCQSMALLRWASKQSDLYPKDIKQALLVDEIVESVVELRTKIPDHKDDAERKRLREEYLTSQWPKYLDYVTRRLESSGGPYFLGKTFSMADLAFARVVAGIFEKRYDYISSENFSKWPAVLRHYEAVQKHPIYSNEVKAEEERQKKAASQKH
jgi:glutathione S-transferase